MRKRTPKRVVHVLPRKGKWVVKSAGATKAAKITDTMAEAIQVGRRIAMNRGSELIVHRPDGTMRSRDSYGSDPFPPVTHPHRAILVAANKEDNMNKLSMIRIWPDNTWQDAEDAPFTDKSDDYIVTSVTEEEYEKEDFSYDELIKRIKEG